MCHTDIDISNIWSFSPNLQIYIFKMYIGFVRYDLLSAIHQEEQDFFYKCLTVYKIMFYPQIYTCFNTS